MCREFREAPGPQSGDFSRRQRTINTSCELCGRQNLSGGVHCMSRQFTRVMACPSGRNQERCQIALSSRRLAMRDPVRLVRFRTSEIDRHTLPENDASLRPIQLGGGTDGIGSDGSGVHCALSRDRALGRGARAVSSGCPSRTEFRNVAEVSRACARCSTAHPERTDQDVRGTCMPNAVLAATRGVYV